MAIRNKRRLSIVGAMWVAALGAVALIAIAQRPKEPAAVPREAGGAPLRHPDRDRAEGTTKRVATQRPIEEGPPRAFRLDRRHTGQSPFVGPGAAERVWAFEVEGRITGQAVVADDGRVLFGSHDRHLYVLSPQGALQWKRDLGGRVYATPYLDRDGNVYVGSDGDAFWSFTRDGRTRFRLATEGDADTGATPSPDGRTIYFGAGSDLWAIGADGTVRWRFRARAKIYSTPAVADDGTIYVGSQDDHLYALAPDGRMRWSYRTGNDNDSSPVVGPDGSVYFGSDDERVYALDASGALRWSRDVDGYVRAPVAIGDGVIVVATFGPRPRVWSLDAESGEVRWAFPVSTADSSEVGISSGPLVDREGSIYVGAHDDYLYSLTPGGELRWIYRTRGDVDSSPSLAPDGTLYFGSDDEHLHALRHVR